MVVISNGIELESSEKRGNGEAVRCEGAELLWH